MMTTMPPIVSVIMPVFNHKKYIGDAIESVLAQTYPHWELLIIDDGSTDGSAADAQTYLKKDSRIAYHYQDNQGEYGARNSGLKFARGQYIAWLDADDYYANQKLEKQVHFLEKNQELGGVGAWMQIVDSTGRHCPDQYRLLMERPAGERLALEYLVLGGANGYGNSPSFMVRRNLFATSGYFRNLAIGTDMDMLFRLDEIMPMVMIKEILYFYRQHNDSSAHRIKKTKKSRRLKTTLGNLAYWLSAHARRMYGVDPLASIPLAVPLAQARHLLRFVFYPRVYRFVPRILGLNKMSIPEFMARLLWAGMVQLSSKVIKKK